MEPKGQLALGQLEPEAIKSPGSDFAKERMELGHKIESSLT